MVLLMISKKYFHFLLSLFIPFKLDDEEWREWKENRLEIHFNNYNWIMVVVRWEKQHKKYNNKSKEPNKTMENLIYINGDENM